VASQRFPCGLGRIREKSDAGFCKIGHNFQFLGAERCEGLPQRDSMAGRGDSRLEQRWRSGGDGFFDQQLDQLNSILQMRLIRCVQDRTGQQNV
jgi:hypothetical protein